MRKDLLMILTLIFTTSFGFGQTDYNRLKKYHKQWNVAIGAKVGDLTGVQIQMYRGFVCPGKRECIFKRQALELTIGDSRSVSQEKFYHNSSDEQIASHGLRIQASAIQGIANVHYTDIYVGLGVQAGQRKTLLTDSQETITNMSVGVTPMIGLEHYIGRFGTRNRPIYLTVFGEGAYYYEVNKRYFSGLSISGGLRLNFWR